MLSDNMSLPLLIAIVHPALAGNQGIPVFEILLVRSAIMSIVSIAQVRKDGLAMRGNRCGKCAMLIYQGNPMTQDQAMLALSTEQLIPL